MNRSEILKQLEQVERAREEYYQRLNRRLPWFVFGSMIVGVVAGIIAAMI